MKTKPKVRCPMYLYTHGDPERAFTTVCLGVRPDNFAETEIRTDGPNALYRLVQHLRALKLVSLRTQVIVRPWGHACQPETTVRKLVDSLAPTPTRVVELQSADG